jgi:hypothetical protein
MGLSMPLVNAAVGGCSRQSTLRPCAGLFTGLEVVVSDQHPFSVELNVSATVLSRADRVRPIDCVTLAQWHGSTNRLPVCSPALVGVEDHAGHGRRRAPRWPHTALRGPSWAS